MMYAKLIFKNAKRSGKDYLIYIVTMTLCVTLFYAFLSISSTHYHPTIGAEYNISLLAGGMKLAICGISLLLLFLIHYVNRFMLRKKQSEFAVEATLGMEQKTIGLLFFGETFFLLIFSVSVGILLGMVVSQVITAMLLASFGEPYAFSWSFFPDTVLLTVGFFVVCQILVGVGNVRILNKSRIIELMTANRQNEKPLHKSRWMPMICIFYTLIGYLDAAHKGLVTGKDRDDYIETARRKAHDLKEYIDVLFDWFKLNSNEFALEIQSVEAAELTRNILIDWIPIFEDKQVDYDIDIPEQPVRVRLDMDSYMRIINNLIQNVIAHSHADKIKISLSKKENSMELLLADNGVGIEKEDLKHIFERLYKCDKGRSEKGSGLGLSIVHQLVEKMGGSITVESLPGKGTEFMLLFPLES